MAGEFKILNETLIQTEKWVQTVKSYPDDVDGMIPVEIFKDPNKNDINSILKSPYADEHKELKLIVDSRDNSLYAFGPSANHEDVCYKLDIPEENSIWFHVVVFVKKIYVYDTLSDIPKLKKYLDSEDSNKIKKLFSGYNIKLSMEDL